MEMLLALMAALMLGLWLGWSSRGRTDARMLRNLVEMRNLVRSICLEDNDISAIKQHAEAWERLTQLVWRSIP